jgi:6-phosphogluconolactonase (cycloisomerase 2 family)
MKTPSSGPLPKAWAISAALLLIAGSALLLILGGCSGSMTNVNMTMHQTPATALMFVSNSGAGTVSAFTISSSGGLTPVAGSPFTAGGGAEFMAFDSMHNLLFVSNQNANSLSAFSVNRNSGVLTAAPGSPFATGSRPTGVAAAPAKGLVFVGNQNDSTVSAFSINATNGSLTPVLGSPFGNISSPFGLTVDPAGTFLFVANFQDAPSGGANAVSAFLINGNGTLTSVTSQFHTSNPAGLTTPVGIATDGKSLFVGNHMAESVAALQIGANGALSASSLPPPNTNGCSSSCHNNPLRLTVDTMDKFVFATNVQAGTVSTFAISNGSLSQTSTANTGQHPFGVSTDPSNAFLFVANKVDNTISGFSINSGSGALSTLTGFPFSDGTLSAPTDIVIVKQTAN